MHLPPTFHLDSHDCLDSTMTRAHALIAERGAAAAGAVVWARSQTGGRGRRGRAWASPVGNLYVSFVVQPSAHLVGYYAVLAAVALREAIGRLYPSVELQLKWPNDVLVDGGKMAGVLLELHPDDKRFLVVGVGVNINSHPDGTPYPATHLAKWVQAEPLMVEAVLEAYVQAFDHWQKQLERDGPEPLVVAWKTHLLHNPGDPITIHLPSETLTGTYLGVDQEGGLRVELAAGGEAPVERRIMSGDVFPGVPDPSQNMPESKRGENHAAGR